MSIIDDKWKLLFDRYDIEKKVSESGPFYITADQIREYKEPRLMTKFDTRESLPSVFGSRLGILPVTRGTYVIGDFDLYADFPEQGGPGNLVPGTRVPGVKKAAIPDYYETIDINDIPVSYTHLDVYKRQRMGFHRILYGNPGYQPGSL